MKPGKAIIVRFAGRELPATVLAVADPEPGRPEEHRRVRVRWQTPLEFVTRVETERTVLLGQCRAATALERIGYCDERR